MNPPDSTGPRHPVRLVSERTGLTPHVLRVWERRYRAVEPARSPGGQRLYSDADIERLRLLNLATQAGRNIGQIAMLPNEQLQDLIRADQQPPRALTPATTPETEPLLAEALEQTERLEGTGLEATLRRAITSLGVHRGIDLVVSPMLAEIGERWHSADLTPAHEHLAAASVQRVLSGLLGDFAAGPADRPHLLVATPSRQRHELGAMMVAVTAAVLGWRLTYLGTDLPVSDILHAARASRAEAVALSLIHPGDDMMLARELVELERGLPATCHLFLGGAAAAAYTSVLNPRRVEALPDLASLRLRLQELKARGTHLGRVG